MPNAANLIEIEKNAFLANRVTFSRQFLRHTCSGNSHFLINGGVAELRDIEYARFAFPRLRLSVERSAVTCIGTSHGPFEQYRVINRACQRADRFKISQDCGEAIDTGNPPNRGLPTDETGVAGRAADGAATIGTDCCGH
jgi:hypothetical protein